MQAARGNQGIGLVDLSSSDIFTNATNAKSSAMTATTTSMTNIRRNDGKILKNPLPFQTKKKFIKITSPFSLVDLVFPVGGGSSLWGHLCFAKILNSSMKLLIFGWYGMFTLHGIGTGIWNDTVPVSDQCEHFYMILYFPFGPCAGLVSVQCE